MNLTNNILELSASDLSNHIACNHLSFLNLSMAKGEIAAPEYRDNHIVLNYLQIKTFNIFELPFFFLRQSSIVPATLYRLSDQAK